MNAANAMKAEIWREVFRPQLVERAVCPSCGLVPDRGLCYEHSEQDLGTGLKVVREKYVIYTCAGCGTSFRVNDPIPAPCVEPVPGANLPECGTPEFDALCAEMCEAIRGQG